MRQTLLSALVAAGIAISGGNTYAAITATQLGSVVAQFGIGIDGSGLWSTSAYGVSTIIDGVSTTPTYITGSGLGSNKAAMIDALAAAANVTTVTKAGTTMSVIMSDSSEM